jgi:hypothetical protein
LKETPDTETQFSSPVDSTRDSAPVQQSTDLTVDSWGAGNFGRWGELTGARGALVFFKNSFFSSESDFTGFGI